MMLSIKRGLFMRIAIGSDHAGFELKEFIKLHLEKSGHEVEDFGTFSKSTADYPDFAKKVASSVAADFSDMGVLVCGSGVGMCMAANRYRGVRAAVLRSVEDAKLSRSHNDANVACLGARLTAKSDALALIDAFFSESFEGGRHLDRIKKIEI
jgi:ribose 5-phosphate isomerase B